LAVVAVLALGYGGVCEDMIGMNTESGSSAKKSFWTIQSGTILDDTAYDVKTESNGNIYVSGTTGGNLHDQIRPTNQVYSFIAKYSSDGSRRWTRISDYTSAYGRSLSLDSYGKAYLAYFVGFDYGSFMEKYTTDGVKEWVRPVSTTAVVSDIMVDSAGNICITGSNQRERVHGVGNISYEYDNMFVSKYASDMTLIWGHTIKSDGNGDFANAIATDSNGNVYIAGQVSGNLDGNMSAGENDIFIIKYNPEGVKQWTIQSGTNLSETIQDIVIDSNNNMYAVGATLGNLDGNTGIITLKYNSDGIRQWTRGLGSPGNHAYGVSLDPVGNLYVAGITCENLDGNAFVGGSAGNYFITKYTVDGVKQWTRISGTYIDSPSRFTCANGVAADFNGNIYAVGITYGSLDGNTPMGQADYFVVKYNSSGIKQ
ncbi:MAG: SBBP repeat-containing protein, partial [Planctomycetota bacterium]